MSVKERPGLEYAKFLGALAAIAGGLVVSATSGVVALCLLVMGFGWLVNELPV